MLHIIHWKTQFGRQHSTVLFQFVEKHYHEAMKIARVMFVTNGATRLCYGALSLFFVPVHSVAQAVSGQQDSSTTNP